MKDSIQQKLTMLKARHDELSQLMSSPDVISNQDKFREYSKEYAELGPVVNVFTEYTSLEEGLADLEAMAAESDPQVREMAQDELQTSRARMSELDDEIQVLLLPKDPNDNRNVFLEVRAGTGGDEAAIFSGDLFRMYSRYAENNGWRVEILSQHDSGQGGFKEVIAKISGEDVYARLKFESGAHRVQRVPVTESQGRVHTSACTVAILPEADELDEVDINPSELKVDTYRSSGAGGQHVNTTDSAVRITHIPTGIVVECQDERSQHKNRARAMSILSAKIMDEQRKKQEAEQAATRRKLVGSGDRSERIRTYNFPQGRMTDHRINLTLYKLDDIMEGSLDQVIDPLIAEHQADQLAHMGD